MGRPLKQGLEYINLPVNLIMHMGMRRINRECGVNGAFLYICLKSCICGHSYYRHVTSDFCFELADFMHLEEQEIMDLIDKLVHMGYFDAEIYQKYQVLTSEEIQRMYLFVKSKSKHKIATVIRDYALVSPDEKEEGGLLRPETPVSSEEIHVSTEETPENKVISAQRKEKEKEEKEREKINHTYPFETASQNFSSFPEKSEAIKRSLLNDEAWKASIARESGQGEALLPHIEGAMHLFDNYIIATAETETVCEKSVYARRFYYWWRKLQFKPAAAIYGNKSAVIPSAGTRKTAPGTSKMDEALQVCERATEMALQLLKPQEKNNSKV